jgi:hypothetical protein
LAAILEDGGKGGKFKNRLRLRIVMVYVRLVTFKIPTVSAILEDGELAANSK